MHYVRIHYFIVASRYEGHFASGQAFRIEKKKQPLFAMVSASSFSEVNFVSVTLILVATESLGKLSNSTNPDRNRIEIHYIFVDILSKISEINKK